MDDQYLQVCENAARAGGKVLMQCLGRIKVSEKGRNDLVTEADIESQKVISRIVLDAFPGHGFLGEETIGTSDRLDVEATLRQGNAVWIVDPLDGTTNYVHGLPQFAVSIALVENGTTVAGVVFDPFYDECFTASRGHGAFLNGNRIYTSNCHALAESLMAASFSAHVPRDSPEIARFIEIMLRCQAIRRLGSAALNLCYVAAGRLDGYWATSVKAWDVAAGHLVVEEAGGTMSGLVGDEFRLANPRFVAAATRELNEQLVAVLREVGD